MSGHDLAQRYEHLVLAKVAEVSYPSSALLDRAEASLTDGRGAERLASILLDLVEGARHPSPQLLGRLDRLMPYLE